MCTVSLVPHADGARVVFNRDERRTRAAAAPPRPHRIGSRDAVYPVDPEGGGTWIGVNDAGLVLALLNVTGEASRAGPPSQHSRGIIVRGLLGFARVDEAASAAAAIDPAGFAPFRLVMLQDSCVAVATSGGGAVAVATLDLSAPLLFTSSSLGDARVTGPRQRLFDRLVLRGRRGWLEGQSRFHRHRWPRRPEISVRMERDDALTVSLTTVDVGRRPPAVQYEAPVAARELRGHRECRSQH